MRVSYACGTCSVDSAHPGDLWNWMDGQRKAGNELLAVSHNASLGVSYMYPIDLEKCGCLIDARERLNAIATRN